MTNENPLPVPVPVHTVSKSEMKICPTCRNAMSLLLVKGARGRKYQCLDCSGEDPLQSPDIRKLLQNIQPPK
jgi:hypothetical protein